MSVQSAKMSINRYTGNISIIFRKNETSDIINSSPLDKMAAISQAILSDAFSRMKKFGILLTISLKFVPKGPIDNNPALV